VFGENSEPKISFSVAVMLQSQELSWWFGKGLVSKVRYGGKKL
jgi:hypothetical protein